MLGTGQSVHIEVPKYTLGVPDSVLHGENNDEKSIEPEAILCIAEF